MLSIPPPGGGGNKIKWFGDGEENSRCYYFTFKVDQRSTTILGGTRLDGSRLLSSPSPHLLSDFAAI